MEVTSPFGLKPSPEVVDEAEGDHLTDPRSWLHGHVRESFVAKWGVWTCTLTMTPPWLLGRILGRSEASRKVVVVLSRGRAAVPLRSSTLSTLAAFHKCLFCVFCKIVGAFGTGNGFVLQCELLFKQFCWEVVYCPSNSGSDCLAGFYIKDIYEYHPHT